MNVVQVVFGHVDSNMRLVCEYEAGVARRDQSEGLPHSWEQHELIE